MRRLQLAFAALLLAGEFALGEGTYPGYIWEEVARGVYLHRSIDPLAPPVDGNCVIIDTGPGVVVVDTHINPAVARAVVDKVRSTIGKPVTHIVNTHWHDDHVNGNYVWQQSFPEASVVAHRATLASLKSDWKPMEEGRQKAYADVEPAALIAAADTLKDPAQAMQYRVYAGYVAALKPELSSLKYVYPDTVFADQLALGSGSRKLELHWLGRGNTDGDAVVWLPDEKVLVTGDLVVAPIPFAFDSPMVEWADTLKRLSGFNAKTIIPGHGPAQSDYAYIEKLLALIEATIDAVRNAHNVGVSFEELASAVALSRHHAAFVNGDPAKEFAWQSYFLSPGLKSAWTALGFPVSDP
tara:strand:- start:660 stop:1721 length:1062 start_codon:yes stop_codon:yes gene_type:complete